MADGTRHQQIENNFIFLGDQFSPKKIGTKVQLPLLRFKVACLLGVRGVRG